MGRGRRRRLTGWVRRGGKSGGGGETWKQSKRAIQEGLRRNDGEDGMEEQVELSWGVGTCVTVISDLPSIRSASSSKW